MLDQILQVSRERAARLDPGALRAAAGRVPPPLDFAGALSGPGLAVIAEVKRRSPSRGALAAGLDPAEQAGRYEQGGAAAVSVLTEPRFFDGSLKDLARVRDAVRIPVLRKDFIVEPAQVWEARAAGADAVLLIVAALTPTGLEGLMAETRSAGMEALVEVHSGRDVVVALDAGATLIGVNTRDLRTFDVDPTVAERLAPRLAAVPVRVAESGIDGPAAAARMQAAGYHAVLVGEALVTSDDPAALVEALRRAGEMVVP